MEHYYLAHHGIKGQKWGVRRFQNTDGSLTSAGKQRYGVANEGIGKGLRTLQVQSVGRRQDRENNRINRRLEKRSARSEAKLAAAKKNGASSEKIAKLQTRADRAKLRQEYVADRNERYKQIKLNYAKKSFGRRFLDPDTWYDTSMYRASMETSNRMKEKYGSRRVEDLEAHDDAVAIGTIVAATAVASAIPIAAAYIDENY